MGAADQDIGLPFGHKSQHFREIKVIAGQEAEADPLQIYHGGFPLLLGIAGIHQLFCRFGREKVLLEIGSRLTTLPVKKQGRVP